MTANVDFSIPNLYGDERGLNCYIVHIKGEELQKLIQLARKLGMSPMACLLYLINKEWRIDN